MLIRAQCHHENETLGPEKGNRLTAFAKPSKGNAEKRIQD